MSHARAVTRRIPPILRADACQHDVRLSGYPNRYTVMKSALDQAAVTKRRDKRELLSQINVNQSLQLAVEKGYPIVR